MTKPIDPKDIFHKGGRTDGEVIDLTKQARPVIAPEEAEFFISQGDYARRFIALNDGRVVWSPEFGKWLVWDGVWGSSAPKAKVVVLLILVSGSTTSVYFH